MPKIGADSPKSLQQDCPLFQVPTSSNLFDLRHVGKGAWPRDSYDKVSALDSGSSGPGSGPGWGHCVVFLGNTLYSHGASLHPGV